MAKVGETSPAVISAHGLKRHFPITKGLVLRRQVGSVRAVDGLDFTIAPSQSFTIVGESGCGKTTTARLVLKLDRPSEGDILFDGRSIAAAGPSEMRGYRHAVQAVFQDPYSSLNPRMKVTQLVSESLRAAGASAADLKQRVTEAIEAVGLPPEAASRYPHMFSGGQRQRIAIARAIVSRPRLIVLDEPVSALDVSIRAQILNLLRDLQSRYGIAYLMISHDLATVRFISDVVAVMYLGVFVETGPAETVFTRPRHPYTQSLIAAASIDQRPIAVDADDPSEPPSAAALPSGCRFHPRCLRASAICKTDEPPLRPLDGVHVACHHPLEVA